MGSAYLRNLAPTNTPEPWLAVMSPGREDFVVHVAASEEELDLWALRKQWINWIKLGHDIVPMADSPSLAVQYSSGLFSCGYLNATPVHLAARKNWFLRYEQILGRY